MLVTLWLALFGDRAMRVRDVLDVAFASTTRPELRDAITAFLANTDPAALNKRFLIVENQPFPNDRGSYSSPLVGHRWRLLPAEARIPP